MVMTLLMSGLPPRIPAVPLNTRTSTVASGRARRRLRISGVVSNTSPKRRSVMTRIFGLAGNVVSKGNARLQAAPRGRRTASLGCHDGAAAVNHEHFAPAPYARLNSVRHVTVD